MSSRTGAIERAYDIRTRTDGRPDRDAPERLAPATKNAAREETSIAELGFGTGLELS